MGKHVSTPKPGLNASNIKRIGLTAANLSGVERYVGIVFDEMRISSGLVFDKACGDLVGYVDLGDPLFHFISFEKCNDFATHALVFLVPGICSVMKSVLSYTKLTSIVLITFRPWGLQIGGKMQREVLTTFF